MWILSKIPISIKIYDLFTAYDKDDCEILFERKEDAYKKSSEFAEKIFNEGFDGILYAPCTTISGVVGPCNDPMLVLFEPKRKDRKLFSYYHSKKSV